MEEKREEGLGTIIPTFKYDTTKYQCDTCKYMWETKEFNTPVSLYCPHCGRKLVFLP